MGDTNRRRWTPVLLFAATAAIALVIYAKTANPGLYWSDTAEFQRVAYTLDLPHPTGYPFYLLLGHLWITLWPFGSIPFKMNLLSGVFAALTVGLVSALVYRVTRQAVAAVSGGLILALAYSFWSQAVIAEVYTLHTLLVAGILLTLLWNRPPRVAWLPLTALLLGLSLVHHRMAFLLLPGVAAYVLCERLWKGVSLRWAVAILVAFGLGLSPLLLTYLQQDWPTFRAFLGVLLLTGNQRFHLGKLPEYVASTIWPLLRQQMGVLGLLLAMLGLGYSYRRLKPRSWGAILLLGISWLLAALFMTVFRVGGIFAFFPHFLVLNAILIGFGLTEVVPWLKGLQPLAKQPWLAEGIVCLLMVTFLLWMGYDSWQINDHSQDRTTEERSLSVLGHVQSDSLLLARWPAGQPLRYLQEMGGFRQDLEIVIAEVPAPDKVRDYVDSGRPAFFWGEEWLEPIDRAAYQIVFVELGSEPQDLFRAAPRDSLSSGTPFRKAVHQSIAADLQLDSYEFRPWPLEADGMVALTLCWSGNTGLLRDRTLEFSLDTERDWLSHRFLAAENLDASGCNAHYLILPPAPFTASARGEIRILQRDRPEPEAVISMEALAIVPGQNVTAERLMLEGASPPELFISRAELLGASNDATISPGASFPIDAYWRVPAEAELGAAVQLELRDGAGNAQDRQVWDLTAVSNAGRAPRSGIYAARYWLSVPRQAEPGTYTIHMGAADSSETVQVSTIEVQAP